ncbi:MAG: HAD family hydrolase [Acaryochloridaceae cyanobacterium SU_2_1]|nr:HAD family hydrolase [Acaryochloridaceae cyanobacterium SU_2_1]
MINGPCPPTALPRTLALDFDGVLCDGLPEYFSTAWRVYRRLWQTSNPEPPEDLATRFYRLRPVIETGWEMPILVRAILQDFLDRKILDQWGQIRDQIVRDADLNSQTVSRQIDGVRDHWIAEDLSQWLALHQFYPGVIAQLQQLLDQNIELVIISTKESRFIKMLLAEAGLVLAEDRIYGKDCRRPKVETLRLLKPTLPSPIWFIEDRLAALLEVQQQRELAELGLFLADWGYTTVGDRNFADQDPHIHRLTLSQFCQDLASWV